MSRTIPALLLFFLLSACRTAAPAQSFWNAIRPLCGNAYEGTVIEGTAPSDDDFRRRRLVMHVRSCSSDEIRIGFIAGADRSRTWVLTPTATGVRLKHDHRHEDGTEDRISQYGGDTRAIANPLSLDFHADAFTGTLIPTAKTNIWTMAVEPGRTFVYALRREEEGRRFRVEFDLTRPVPAP